MDWVVFASLGIISSDEIRKEITGSEDNQECNEEVFKVLHQRVKDELLYNKSQAVIYDACNISYKKRMAFLNELNKINCRKVCYFVHTPFEMCLENNKKRVLKMVEDLYRSMQSKECIKTFIFHSIMRDGMRLLLIHKVKYMNSMN